MSNLKEKIQREMTADYGSALERNFELAKEFIRLTKEGKVEVTNKERFSGEDIVSLYLIGKCYSKEVGYSETSGVTSKELQEELGKPEGSILPWLKRLRDANKIRQDKSVTPSLYYITVNQIEPTLNNIQTKIK